MTEVRNPFRAQARQRQFEAAVADYENRVKALFRVDGRENRMNNIGEAFWRGFNGQTFIWDVECALWPAFRAGQEIARAAGRKGSRQAPG